VNIVQRRIRQALRERGNVWGSVSALAREIGVSAPFLTMVLSGRKRPGPKVLAYFGLKARETYYQRPVGRDSALAP
jgi:hypothetical protein